MKSMNLGLFFATSLFANLPETKVDLNDIVELSLTVLASKVETCVAFKKLAKGLERKTISIKEIKQLGRNISKLENKAKNDREKLLQACKDSGKNLRDLNLNLASVKNDPKAMYELYLLLVGTDLVKPQFVGDELKFVLNNWTEISKGLSQASATKIKKSLDEVSEELLKYDKV